MARYPCQANRAPAQGERHARFGSLARRKHKSSSAFKSLLTARLQVRVVSAELAKRLRNSVTVQLTENPERMTLGVFAFWANKSGGLPDPRRGGERRASAGEDGGGPTGAATGPDPLSFSGQEARPVNSTVPTAVRS